MTEEQCVAELLAKDWSPGRYNHTWRKGDWTIERMLGGGMYSLFFDGRNMGMIRKTLADLLRAEMPDSAAVSVATYFGLVMSKEAV